MNSRKRKFFLIAIVSPLWLGVLFLAGELIARQYFSYLNIAKYCMPVIEARRAADQAVFEATAAGAPRPPDDVVARFPVLEDLEGADDAKVDALATQWQSIVIECDRNGGIRHVSMPAPHPDILPVAHVAESAHVVTDLVEEDQKTFLKSLADDAVERRRVRGELRPYALGPGTMMEFCQYFPGKPAMGILCYIYPYLEPTARGGDEAVVIIPGRFDVCAFKYRPNVYLRKFYSEFNDSEFWTNSLGFRDGEVVLPKPPGVVRIVCVGGSTTVGGPRNDLTYPNLLEKKLRAHFKSDRIEVINGGVDGMGLGGVASRIDDFMALEPDYILLYKFVNDGAWIMQQAVNVHEEEHPTRCAISDWLSKSRIVEQFGQGMLQRLLPSTALYEMEARKVVNEDLEKLREGAAAGGAELAIASFAVADLDILPPMERAWFRSQFFFGLPHGAGFDAYVRATRAFNHMLQGYCESNGLIYIPVEENLRGGMNYFTDTAHMTVTGIDAKASICAEHLREKIAGKMNP